MITATQALDVDRQGRILMQDGWLHNHTQSAVHFAAALNALPAVTQQIQMVTRQIAHMTVQSVLV